MDDEVMAPVDVQLDAYNSRDIDAFMTAYAVTAQIIRLPGTVVLSGEAAIRQRYEHLFETSPQLRAAVHSRTVLGNWVVDHETVTGASIEGIGEAVVAYEVAGGKIVNVFIMK